MSKSSLAPEWTNLALSGGAEANDVMVQTLNDWRDKRPELFKKSVYNLQGLYMLRITPCSPVNCECGQ